MQWLRDIWHSRDLRRRILFTLGIILLFRIAALVPVPGVDLDVLRLATESGAGSVLPVLSLLTGGSFENFSIIMMGLAPFINASIIIQLLTVVIPKLEQMKKEEGEQGQKKLISYGRWLTLPLAFLQSYGMILLIQRGSALPLFEGGTQALIIAMITITAGTLFLMWLGELITEKGIGNGISLIIFAGIVSAVPGIIGDFSQNVQLGFTDNVGSFALFGVFTVVMLVIVSLVMEAQRPIGLMSSSGGGVGARSNLPIRVLQAGMIPVIFAISLLTFPTVMATLLNYGESSWLRSATDFWLFYFSGDRVTVAYLVAYCVLIIFFTFFYVSIVFQPDQVAENLQKRGNFIPGIRPGTETADYIEGVSNRMNLWGGLFLAFVAMTPLLFVRFGGLTHEYLILSGAGLIIVVSVVLELMRQVRSRLASHDYDRLETPKEIR